MTLAIDALGPTWAFRWEACNWIESLQRRKVLCYSFFGFEEPVHLPPNIYLTGPPMDGKKDPNRLRLTDPQLADWVDDA